MLTLLTLALLLFVVTHIDTLLVLIAFFTDTQYRIPEILVGHYVGFSVGLAVAISATLVAPAFIGDTAFLFGLVPLALGLWGFRHRQQSTTELDHSSPGNRNGRIAVVSTTGIGLSGENIAVFVPFFLTLSLVELTVVIGAFLLAAAVVFVLAYYIAKRTLAAGISPIVQQRLVPAVLVGVGLYIIAVGWLAA